MFAITFGSLFFQEVQPDGSHLWSPRRADAQTFTTEQEAESFLASSNLTVGAHVARLQ